MNWNILVVDDDHEQATTTAELISGEKITGIGSVKCTVLDSFTDALEQIEHTKFDLLVLDLKDDSLDENGSEIEYSGEKILKKLKRLQFTPVVFYSGFSGKIEHLRSPFVKMATKGSAPAELRAQIKEVFETQLPQLLRHIQEEQRKYLWDHIENAWQKHQIVCENKELAYLLARRLANALEGKVIRKFFNPAEVKLDEIAHPIEIYIWPPLGDALGFGDVIEKIDDGQKTYFVVLNPACDFAQCKTEKVLLAECSSLNSMAEYTDIQKIKAGNLVKTKEGQIPEEISKSKMNALRYLMQDNRQVKGVQADRFKFLPKTTFIPDLVIDYQSLSQIPVGEIAKSNGYTRVATLDAPYAEAVQSRFIRYYGRIGTPDLEFDVLLDELISNA